MTEKKRRGRPPLGEKAMTRSEYQRQYRVRNQHLRRIVSVEIPTDMLAQIDLFQAQKGVEKRSAAIRDLIQRGLSNVA